MFIEKRGLFTWARFKEYYQSHMWCSFALIILIFLLLIVGIVQSYFKDEYIEYLKDKTYETENTILTSVNENLNYLLFEFVQAGSKIAIDNDLYDLVEAYEVEEDNQATINRNLRALMSTYSQYSRWITNISIVSADGLVYQYDRQNFSHNKLWHEGNQTILHTLHENIFSLLSIGTITKFVSSPYPLNHPQNENLELFHFSFPLKGNRNFDQLSYSLVVSFNIDLINELLHMINSNSQNVTNGYISDENNIIIFHNKKENIGKYREEYLNNSSSLENLSTVMDIMDWDLNIVVDEDQLLQQVEEIYYKGIFLYGIVLFVIIGLLIYIIEIVVLKPVSEISRSIFEVKNGGLDKRINIEGSHEIWQLAEEYNNMVTSLKDMNKKVEKYHREKYTYMKKKQKAEQEALKSQINAHFIHNTLGVINFEAIESGNHDISVLIKKLSNILRYTFNKEKEIVTISQELAWVEQYLFLQKYRMENVFEYRIDFPAQLQNWPSIKLMLQPFVENSIIHGFEGVQKGGEILIKGELLSQRLKLIIEDNGCGIKEEKKRTIKNILDNPMDSHNKEDIGIGISNVMTRMYMYYGKDLEAKLETVYGKGSKFFFYIPKPKEI